MERMEEMKNGHKEHKEYKEIEKKNYFSFLYFLWLILFYFILKDGIHSISKMIVATSPCNAACCKASISGDKT